MPPDSDTTPLDVAHHPINGVSVISIDGELDVSGVDSVVASLSAAQAGSDGPLVLDLTECSFVDSTGLAAILHGLRPLIAGERPFGLACPDGNVRDLLRLTAIDQTLAVYDSRESALAALTPV